MLLGVLYAKNRKRAPALAKFKRALELNPMLSDAWIAQAQVRYHSPRQPGAHHVNCFSHGAYVVPMQLRSKMRALTRLNIRVQVPHFEVISVHVL